jgi:hypothetical protein
MAALLVAVEAGSIRLAGQRDCAMTPLPRPFEDRHHGAEADDDHDDGDDERS